LLGLVSLRTFGCVLSSPAPTPAPGPGRDDATWFDQEVQPHGPALRSFLQRRFPSLSEVDDVVQQSLLKTLDAGRKGKLVSVKGFLFRVAINSTLSLFRRRKFISDTPVNEMRSLRVVEENIDVVETVCTRDELALVAEAVAQLPERCRHIVTLRVLHGLEYPAIAQQLGVSVSTVRVQVARGMAKCAEFLKSRGVVPETKR
jgi:RNA polymerase sigma-70 factor (ECF subfamily)